MKFLLQFLILVFVQERPLALILNNDSGIRVPQLVASSKIVKILKLENDFITIQTENFPMDYSEDYIYVWEVQAPPSRRITIRKNLLNLRADDQLRISEIIWNKTLALGNFSATAPEFKKITSLGNALRLELILGKSNSSSAMSSSGFILTCEITGFCSDSDPSRMSCNDKDPNVCFSLGSLSTPAPNLSGANSTSPSPTPTSLSPSAISSRYGDRCDGVWDCPRGGFDEQNCEFCARGYLPCASDAFSYYSTETAAAATTTTTTTTSTASPPLLTSVRLGRKSRSGRVAAAVGPLCYPASARCDGHYNCPDHSDELGCSADVCSLGSQRFLCDPLGPLGQCILLDNVCNSVPDCYNGADELEDLCLRNTSEAAGFLPEVARLIAQRVARQALETSLAVATSQLDSDLRRVLTYSLSALIAPLLSTLAFGFICRSHAVRTRRRLRRAPRFNSPILRLLREELRRRPPPPTYSEALDNSLFEEPILECAGASQSAPPLIPLSSTGLTRAQVESVRQRSMKPSNRVDVSCSCDLSSISDGLPRGDREHGQRHDEDEEDDDDDDAGMDDSSEEDDEEEGGVVMGQADGDNLPAQVAGERGPVEPSQTPGESQSPPPPPLPAATASPACPSSARSDGSGRLWQWINRLRRLGGAYQRIQAGASGGETSTSALVTAVASGSDAPIGEFFSDAGSDLSRRQPPHHSVNPDEADAAGPSRTSSASLSAPGDGTIPASAFARPPEQTSLPQVTVPLLSQPALRVAANPDCSPAAQTTC